MNRKLIMTILGKVLLAEAILMALPAIVALIYGESILPFIIPMFAMASAGLSLSSLKSEKKRIVAKDGFVSVALAWIVMSLCGALPFVISGAIPNYIDALFETASGFTTTGASILTEIESLPRGILFWRSFTHWVGGMGVLMFIFAIVPSDNGQAMYLMRAEVPGPTKGKITPKLKQTAMILYGIYVILTASEMIALLFCRMPLYDSLVNALATAGTGGFSVLNSSIAGYNNPAAEWVIAVFMIIFGINFNIYYLISLGRLRDAFKNEELKVYGLLFTASTAIITVSIVNSVKNFGTAIRQAFFQVASIISTTGFATVDFNEWHSLPKAVIVFLMFTGACAGSTAGGLKLSRVILIFKNSIREIKHMIRPNSVNTVRIDGNVVAEETLRGASNYFGLYMIITVLSVLLVSVDGFGFTENVTSVISCVNNIGPGLGEVGPAGNFSGFSYFSKIVFTLDMLLGRLEILPILILFTPQKRLRRKS